MPKPKPKPKATKKAKRKRKRNADADARWLDAFPLAALRADSTLPLTWIVDEDVGRRAGAELAAHCADAWPQGVRWSTALWAACRDAAAGLVCVATGPEFLRRAIMPIACALYLHPERPEPIWFAPSPEFPAALWIPLAPTVDAVRTLFAPLAARA